VLGVRWEPGDDYRVGARLVRGDDRREFLLAGTEDEDRIRHLYTPGPADTLEARPERVEQRRVLDGDAVWNPVETVPGWRSIYSANPPQMPVPTLVEVMLWMNRCLQMVYRSLTQYSQMPQGMNSSTATLSLASTPQWSPASVPILLLRPISS